MAKKKKARGLGKEDGEASNELVEYAKSWIKVLEELDEAKNKKAEAEEKKKEIQRDFVEAMKNEGVKSFRLEGLGLFRTQIELYPNVTKEGRGELESYIRKRKTLKFLWTTSINGSKLKAWVKELREQGKQLPPGVDPYEETQIRRNK